MKTCKDCIHYNVCDYQKMINHKVSQSVCKKFKNESNWKEVVRCKDCKYYEQGDLLAPNKFCFRLVHKGEHIGFNFSDDDFCSYGVKMDGGNENA